MTYKWRVDVECPRCGGEGHVGLPPVRCEVCQGAGLVDLAAVGEDPLGLDPGIPSDGQRLRHE